MGRETADRLANRIPNVLKRILYTILNTIVSTFLFFLFYRVIMKSEGTYVKIVILLSITGIIASWSVPLIL